MYEVTRILFPWVRFGDGVRGGVLLTGVLPTSLTDLRRVRYLLVGPGSDEGRVVHHGVDRDVETETRRLSRRRRDVVGGEGLTVLTGSFLRRRSLGRVWRRRTHEGSRTPSGGEGL